VNTKEDLIMRFSRWSVFGLIFHLYQFSLHKQLPRFA